jgi:hypothetical protein
MITNNLIRAASIAALAVVTSGALAEDGSAARRAPDPLSPATLVQLEQARQATAKFLDVDAATHAGYVDIGVFMPHMGWHYLNTKVLDGRFDPGEPELLVYADDPCGGKRRLVAVEYAVPLDASARPPQGFQGHEDRWNRDEDFQLWTLHAWVWEFNPDGVFAPFNPRVEAQP